MTESYFLYLLLVTFLFVYFELSNQLSSFFVSSVSCRSLSSYAFSKKSKLVYVIPIIVLSLVLGLRYNVGTDYLAYKEIYDTQNSDLFWNIVNERIEPLYQIINHIPFLFGLPYYYMSILVCFIMFSLFYLSLDKDRDMVKWYCVTLLISGTLFSFLNIQRHAMAFCVFLFSIRYVYNRSLFKYLICILIAMGFHYSSFILFPCYLLGVKRKILIDDWRIQCVLCVLVLFLSKPILSYMFDFIMNYAPQGYAGYGEQILSKETGLSEQSLFLSFMTTLIIVISSKYLLYRHTYEIFVVYYRLYFMGMLFTTIFADSILLSRLIYPLVSLNFIVYAYMYRYVFHCIRKCNLIMMVCSFSIFFITNITFLLYIWNSVHKCSPFQFVSL